MSQTRAEQGTRCTKITRNQKKMKKYLNMKNNVKNFMKMIMMKNYLSMPSSEWMVSKLTKQRWVTMSSASV